MGRKGEDTRARIIATTGIMLAEQGYFATGINEIADRSGSPRGSLYFHFPEGKDQIVAEALLYSGRMITGLIRGAEADSHSSKELLTTVVLGLAAQFEASDCKLGCPVASVALEVASSHPRLRAVCDNAYSEWIEAFAQAFARDGIPSDVAGRRAEFVFEVLEGALLLAKVRHDADLIRTALGRILDIVDSVG